MSSQNDVQLVNPQPFVESVASVSRSVALVIGSVVSVAGFVSKHDWLGLAAYIQSQPAITAGSTVVAAVSLGYGTWRAYKRSSQVLTAAQNPRNTAIAVKQ